MEKHAEVGWHNEGPVNGGHRRQRVSLRGETEWGRGRTDSGQPPSKMASPEENE